MPRLCQPPLALLFGAVALIAALAAAPHARAQGSDAADRYLMRPQVDGDPRNPPRFRRSGGVANDAGRFGQNADTGFQSGAGATGFDSTSPRGRKDKKGQKSKSAGTARSAATLSGLPTATATQATAARASAVGADPAAATVIVSPTAARFTQNQNQNQNQAQGQNQNQALSQNQTQQPRAPPSTNAAYPVAPLTDVVATPARRRAVPELDPYAPIGIQAGAFILKPALELTGAYDTNPARTVTATPSWYSVVAPELLVNSNWSRHELTANLRGSFTSYENASDLNRPSVDAKVNGRVDVTPWTRIDLEGRYLLGTDNPGSPNIQVGLARLPIFTTLGGSAGIGQRFNRFEVTLKGSSDRTVYEDSSLTDGTTSSNADRDYNRFGAELRASYELLPGVKPFVETGADRREHDIAIDRNGMQRDSDGRYVKGGSTFEITRVLTGDVAVGFVQRNYKDPTLPDVGGLTFDSSLTWVASALTTVKLAARTTVDESILSGVSGVFTREIGLQVDHAFRRWLIATLKYTVDFDDYVGLTREDRRHAVSALLTYKLTRELALKAEYRREWRHSNEPGNDNLANVVLFGIRLQR